ncbi:MAG TPA: dihydropteroate synthase, partial [Clostridiales bacterium]|nr:dihydropteroate synthase [Clostridiales bacterium]
AVRIYNGRPVINSVNGKSESLDTILPLAVKYGAAVIALTLDDNGIPKTAEGRLLIAKRILSKALDYGLKKEDVIIDCLTLTALTNQVELIETLKSVKLVKSTLGIRTVLGISNVFFPMPSRKLLNSVFLAAALGAGLDIPILDPLSDEGMRVISAYRVINNEDPGAEALIKKLNN